MTTLPNLLVESRQGAYPVTLQTEISDALSTLAGGKEADYLVCDANVWRIHGAAIREIFGDRPTYVVEASEETKTLAGVGALVDWLIEHRAIRSSRLVAIGGGCIQDLVGFTAHIYYRGIAWTFLPTTLLSQADSCIGAKTGINVLPFKNQLGVLHSPQAVTIASDFLQSLPESELTSGLGEIVKLSVTSSRHFLDTLEEHLHHHGARAEDLLGIVRASLVAKQEIIEQDEYEADLRRILNYGHSFGHALEALTDHQVPHGIAVLWGIDVINWLGVHWGITDPGTAARLRTLTEQYFDMQLPIEPSAEQLLDMIGRDKKMMHGQMHFAVLESPGRFRIEPRSLDAGLADQVTEYLQTAYVFRPR